MRCLCAGTVTTLTAATLLVVTLIVFAKNSMQVLIDVFPAITDLMKL